MPRTIIKCSARRKRPYCWRWATMRAARAWPMPGRRSNSSGDAVLILTSGAPVVSWPRIGGWLDASAGWRGNLTQEAPKRDMSASGTNEASKRFTRALFLMQSEAQRGRPLCRVRVQNARSLKNSGTCNIQRRLFHRVFHRFLWKSVETVARRLATAGVAFQIVY